MPGALRRAPLRRSWYNQILDVAFPPVCLHCKAEILSHNALCATCFAQTERISTPFCHGCAAPLPAAEHLNQNHLCIYCQNSRPPWSAARAAFIFGDATQSLIFDLKYGDRTELATFFAHAMMRHGAALLSDADLIAPVPLHWWRLLRRKFNQSAIIAQSLCRMHPARLQRVPDLLKRVRHTGALARLGPDARMEKVREAITLSPRYRGMVQGRRVILVDDILTTGATLSICSQRLLDAGAAEVSILVATRSGRHILPFAHKIHGFIDAED